MSYRLLKEASVGKDARRVAREQIDRAIENLGNSHDDPHEAIHDSRKRLKKLRGLLRLLRGELDDVYQRENHFFRDEARRLAAARDAEAMIETFDQLAERFEGELDDEMVQTIRATLVARRDEIAEKEMDLDERISQVIDNLRHARARVRKWDIERDGFAAIKPGLLRTYRRARVAMKEAYKEETAEAFHEWRKRVKYHRYHVRLLRDLWPKLMKGRRKALKELSDYLGDDHDLAVFDQMLCAESARFDPKQIEVLQTLSDIRHGELRAAARRVGRKLFAEKPKRLAKRWSKFHRAEKQARRRGK